jgi:hypothetical protein
MDMLVQISRVNVGADYQLCFSRDLFLFSRYADGLNFRYIAMLKKENLQDGCLKFVRYRRGYGQSIPLNGPMKTIIDRYHSANEYLFPIIRDTEKNLYQQYRAGLELYNQHIKRLLEMIEESAH